MKTITVNVSEVVYREFQEYARLHDRTAAELIREAMEAYRRSVLRVAPSVRELQPLDLGQVLRPVTADDDLLSEMLE